MAARVLDVWFFGRKAGQLVQGEAGRLSFSYDDDYRAAPPAWPLSVSLPVQAEVFDDRLARPFFSGLLPDDLVRHKIAKYLGVSEKNPVSLLEIIGGECAGAISLYPEGVLPPQEKPDDIELLDAAHLDEIFALLKRRPLLAGEHGVRLSLAGAQDKLAVRLIKGKIALMHGGAPTTHILKPLIAGRTTIKDSVHNEFFCLCLAHQVGIAVAKAEMRRSAKEPFLLIERYDRLVQGDTIARLHQEDFCQALSVPPENKYENEGGPGIDACLQEIRRHSVQPIPDRLAFLKIVIFNYLIGNADAHGKNFAFLHREGQVSLAPAYDLLSTAIYPDLGKRMAMKLGGKYDPKDVYLRHWLRLVPDTATARKGLQKEMEALAKSVLSEAEKLSATLKADGLGSPIFDDILAVIQDRAGRVIAGL